MAGHTPWNQIKHKKDFVSEDLLKIVKHGTGKYEVYLNPGRDEMKAVYEASYDVAGMSASARLLVDKGGLGNVFSFSEELLHATARRNLSTTGEVLPLITYMKHPNRITFSIFTLQQWHNGDVDDFFDDLAPDTRNYLAFAKKNLEKNQNIRKFMRTPLEVW